MSNFRERVGATVEALRSAIPPFHGGALALEHRGVFTSTGTVQASSLSATVATKVVYIVDHVEPEPSLENRGLPDPTSSSCTRGL